MAFHGEQLHRSRLVGGYEQEHFAFFRTEESYNAQVLTPFVAEVRRVGHTGRVLDLASGRGEAAQFFQQAGLDVVQLDLSPFAVGAAKGHRVLSLSEQTPFPDGSFDAIHMKDGIAHVGDIGEQFKEIARLLVPTGKTLITSAYFGPEKNSFRVWKTDSSGTSSTERIEFDTPDEYESKVLDYLKKSEVTSIAPPNYPRSPDIIKSTAAANGLSLMQESSWTSITRSDWYGDIGNCTRFVLQFEKVT